MDNGSDLLRVFVYGTLKPGELNYQRYCASTVIAASAAIARGQLFSLPAGYPVMALGDGWVHGFVLTLSDPQTLRVLDEYEGYQEGRSPSIARESLENLYDRQVIATFNSSQQPLGLAWAYLMPPDKIHCLGGTLLPHGRWDNPKQPV